jgi:hypothetical protein
MATVTPNFNWPVPTSTDLVKDGATAIEALGDSIDASLVDLKGGTSGQVLSKNSNTDMDFVWVTSDDANAIQNTIVDAKGDLITATAADTPARLAVGANGETLVSDSSTSTGLRYTAGTVQGNPIINSAMQVWQRGTSIAYSSGNPYTADRYTVAPSGAAITISRQATGDTTNLPFIQYCARIQRTAGNTVAGNNFFIQTLETANSIPYAGKTVTFSFYARKGANYSASSSILSGALLSGTGTDQSIATGLTGSTDIIVIGAALTTTWQRFTGTGTIPANATQIGFYTVANFTGTAGAADLYEVTGFQIDMGSVALPFRTYAATIQGELAACQRYYFRNVADITFARFAPGSAASTTSATVLLAPPVPMRVTPTSLDSSTLALSDFVNAISVATAVTLSSQANKTGVLIDITVASGLTQYRPYYLTANSSTTAYIGASAEL